MLRPYPRAGAVGAEGRAGRAHFGPDRPAHSARPGPRPKMPESYTAARPLGWGAGGGPFCPLAFTPPPGPLPFGRGGAERLS